MAARKGGEYELAGVGGARVYLHARDTFEQLHDRGEVGKVKLGIYAMGEKVHGKSDKVDVSRSFSIAEEGAFNAVRACQNAQLGTRHARSPVVMGM